MEIRILEIDASPRIIPSEIERILGPVLTSAQTQVELKACELPDADWPSSHSLRKLRDLCKRRFESL